MPAFFNTFEMLASIVGELSTKRTGFMKYASGYDLAVFL